MAAMLARKGESGPLGKLCRTYSAVFVGFFALWGMTLVLVGPLAVRALYGTRYVGFSPLILPVVAGACASAASLGFGLAFRALRRGRTVAGLQLFGAAAKIALAALSLRLGILAVAWALAAAETLVTCISWLAFAGAFWQRPGRHGTGTA
jgi:hypothetical protein